MNLLFIVSSLCACNEQDARRGDSHIEKKNNEMFRKLSDSVKHLSVNAKIYCDSLMDMAEDSTEYYGYYVLKGNSYLYSSTPDSALIYSTRTRNYALNQQSSPRIMALLAIANTLEASVEHMTRRNPKEAIRLYTESFNQIMQSDYKEYSPDIAANLADAYLFVDDIPTAAKWYRKALFLVDSLSLPIERNVTLYMGLGQIYTTLEDYDSAKKLYEQTDRQYDNMKPNMQTYFLTNYGNYYYYRGDYKNALATFKRLEKHLARINSGQDMDNYTCKINIADTYLNLDRTDSATIYVEEAARFFEVNHVDLGIYYANTIRIGIALRRHDYERVEKILTTEGKLDIREQNIRNIRKRYLMDYYAVTGNYRKAFECAMTYKQENDSAEHNRQNMMASEIMARFAEDTLRLHHELELKKRDVVMLRSRATVWTMMGIVVVLVSIMVSSVFFYRKRKLQVNMDMFMLRLASIRQRISPHFVFNILNNKVANAQKEEADTLVDMAKLIRQNIVLSNRPYVTLYEELNFVKNYVGLQRTLLGENFIFTLDTPDDDILKKIKIPPMFVQMCVENAIKHGLRCIEQGEKRLCVTVEGPVDNLVCIVVTDNGHGIDATKHDTNSTNTGLSVISRTMAMLNRRNKRTAQMRMDIRNIETNDGHIAGCKSELTIPMNMKFD